MRKSSILHRNGVYRPFTRRADFQTHGHVYDYRSEPLAIQVLVCTNRKGPALRRMRGPRPITKPAHFLELVNFKLLLRPYCKTDFQKDGLYLYMMKRLLLWYLKKIRLKCLNNALLKSSFIVERNLTGPIKKETQAIRNRKGDCAWGCSRRWALLRKICRS